MAEERRRYERRVDLVCAASIPPQAIDWLWRNYLACGEFHLLAGAPGTGKTTLAMEIAAVTSVGGDWPDGSSSTQGKVLIWTGEDSIEHTLVPRLMAAGANFSNIDVVQGVTSGEDARAFEPLMDLPLLEAEVERFWQCTACNHGSHRQRSRWRWPQEHGIAQKPAASRGHRPANQVVRPWNIPLRQGHRWKVCRRTRHR
nr:AAA family ATPase [Lysobacter sp. BMK333-48F3]